MSHAQGETVMTAVETTESIDLNTIDFCDPRTYDHPLDVYRAARDLDHLHYDAKNDLYIVARHEDVFHR